MEKQIKSYKIDLFWVTVVFAALMSIFAYIFFLKPLDVFLWDEAHHGFYGMQIFYDIKFFDLPSFWEHTNRQALWMPLHSWLDGIFLIIFGFSYTSARLSSLFLFFVNAIMVFFIGKSISKQKGGLVGFIATLLFITAPEMLSLATLNMQEMLGITVCLGTVLIAFNLIDREVFWKYILVGLMLGVAYWTKLNYALQSVLGVGLFNISCLYEAAQNKFPLKQYKLWLVNSLYLVAGMFPLFALWWLTPPFDRKFALGFSFWKGAGDAVVFFTNIGPIGRAIFYLQSIVTSYTFSFWIGLAMLLSLATSFFFFRELKVRFLSLLFLSNLVLASVVANIQERYLSTTAPLVYVLLAYFAVLFTEKAIQNKQKRVIYFFFTLFACLIIFDATKLVDYTKQVGNRSILFPIYKSYLNKFDPPFMFGLIQRPAFTVPMEQTKKYPELSSVSVSKFADIIDFYKANCERGLQVSSMISLAELSPYTQYWSFDGWGAAILTVNDLGFSPQRFWASDYFIELDVKPNSTFDVDVYDRKWPEVKIMLISQGYIKKIASKEFADLGMTAAVYKKIKE